MSAAPPGLREMEEAVRARHEAEGTAEAVRRARAGGRRAVFVEGPPTLNGPPHIGHMRGRIMKDVWYRHSTLLGADVEFGAGWDTQGLPVELQAEKELGMEGGRSRAGEADVERLAARCREIVARNAAAWERADRALGVSLRHDSAYWTHRDEYIEAEWQVVRRANEAGILRDDYAVIAYCPGCQTSLSHAEVAQGYEEVADPSLYYKVRMEGGEYAVVWTTMPFTLVTDALIAFSPDEEYARVRVGGETWVVGRTRLAAVMEEAGSPEHEVVGYSRGSEFEGARYEHPLLGRVPALAALAAGPKYHRAVAEGFVDAGSGSGIVHVAPANGEEDMAVASRRGVPVFCPIDDAVRFTPEAGEYAGSFVRDADAAVVRDLREAGALVRAGRLRHKYPLCWRSRHRLVWMARRGWFYGVDRLGRAPLEAAAGAEYFFEQPRNRFLGIVAEGRPWCISRERFWGCPLPAWNCSACGHRDWLYSREEIGRAAGGLPEGFELHRPWIDRARVRCSRCGGASSREPYVLDTWHNSGAAPHASGAAGRAAFLTEGIDQTRGWAYTLLIEGVIMGVGAPYESFLFQGHVLDAAGRKMSKSAGNAVGAEELLAEHPADLVRLYCMWKASPIEPLSFDAAEMSRRPRQVLETVCNVHRYLRQNGLHDGFDPAEHTAAAAGRAGLLRPQDAWARSRTQALIREVGAAYAGCRFHEAARAIERYAVDDLSQGYIPLTRAELWDGSEANSGRRMAIYAVLAESLRALYALLHPICPFSTDYLHREAFGGGGSVLLAGWPGADPRLEDAAAEAQFASLREAVSVASAARMRGGLKRRWPLGRAAVCVPRGRGAALSEVAGLLAAQMNVGEVSVHESAGDGALAAVAGLAGAGAPVRPALRLDGRAVGARAGRLMPEVSRAFAAADHAEAAAALAAGGAYPLAGAGGFEVRPGDVSAGIEAGEGWCAAVRGGTAVAVSSERSAELEARGLVRDLARRIQDLRRERGHDPTETLEFASVSGLSPEQEEAVRPLLGELRFLVRVRRVEIGGGGDQREYDVDGRPVRLAVG